MISEKLVLKIFPVKLSYIDKYYITHEKLKSKWFSILVSIDDTTLSSTHYFEVQSFEPCIRDITKPITNNIGVAK